MADGEQRHLMRRDDDRSLLVDHGVRLGRLERDVSQLSDHVERELDALDLKFPTFDRVARDYLARSEQRARAGDARNWTLVVIAAGQLATTLLVVFHHG